MAKQNEPIVIRKRPRQRRESANSGAWKVAFADFTLAMMALFMVLWIIQMADQTEREQIVQYLQGDMHATGSINPFDLSKSPSMIDLEGAIPIQQAILPASGTGVEKSGPALHNHIPAGIDNPKAGRGPELNAMVPGQFETQAQLEFLAREVDKIIKQVDMGTNVAIQVVPQGIRILVHDNVRQSMFTRGSAKMDPYFEDLLLALGPLLAKVENKISISGHTDSSTYIGKTFTNWELSSQRALMARRVLEYGGVKRNQIVQVTGMADQAPFIVNDPTANANRRIEMLVLTQTAERQIKEMAGFPTKTIGADPRLEQAKKLAENNRPRTRYPEQWNSYE
ncbi:flagellar motor protein MotB [Shewanella surugensis]|uniref:OmpA family protein n=1 Tax=Shewanella surugensis TaxID=212020 RepID=A0ABT0LH59_9GAMM|nr:flagellar motor protein MotB [Shewanella surugensis]MCL1126501.1 OmpA family protein [Shewanella surugensis]